MIVKKFLSLLLLTFLVVSASAQSPCANFAQGVSSFNPTSNSISLWGRYSTSENVKYQISTDSGFSNLVASGTCSGDQCPASSNDFTANIPVSSLDPNTRYYYRLSNNAGDCVSSVGQFQTLPSTSQATPVRFAFASDASLPAFGGYNYLNTSCTGNSSFGVLKQIAEQDYDFFLFLGDVANPAQLTDGNIDLTRYREAYRETRIDNYIAALESAATFVQMNQNELSPGVTFENLTPSQINAARQAFEEYYTNVVTEATSSEGCSMTPLYRKIQYGQDVEVFVLDTRSCRTSINKVAEACRVTTDSNPLAQCGDSGNLHCLPEFADRLENIDSSSNDNYKTLQNIKKVLDRLGETEGDCLAALQDADRTMLGQEQLAWLKKNLQESDAKFKLIATPQPMSSTFFDPYDRWEAFQFERDQILSFIQQQQVPGVVFLATDGGFNMVSQITYEDRYNLYNIAPEIVTGPVADGTLEERLREALPNFVNYLEDEFQTALMAEGLTFDVLSNTKFTVSNLTNYYEVFMNTLMTVARGRAPSCTNFNQYGFGEVVYNEVNNRLTVSIKDCEGNLVSDNCLVENYIAVIPKTICTGLCGDRTCSSASDLTSGLFCLGEIAQEIDASLDLDVVGTITIEPIASPLPDNCQSAYNVISDNVERCLESPESCINTDNWDVFTDVDMDVNGQIENFYVRPTVVANQVAQAIDKYFDEAKEFLDNVNPYISCSSGLDYYIVDSNNGRVTVVRNNEVVLSQISNVNIATNTTRTTISLPKNPSNIRIYVKANTEQDLNNLDVQCSSLSYLNVPDNTDFTIPDELNSLEEYAKRQQLSQFVLRVATNTFGRIYLNTDQKFTLEYTAETNAQCQLALSGNLENFLNNAFTDADADFSTDINVNTDECETMYPQYDSANVTLAGACIREEGPYGLVPERFVNITIENTNGFKNTNFTFTIITKNATSDYAVALCGVLNVNKNDNQQILLSAPRDLFLSDQVYVYSPAIGLIPVNELNTCDVRGGIPLIDEDVDDDDHWAAWFILGFGLLAFGLLALGFLALLFYFAWLLLAPVKSAPPAVMAVQNPPTRVVEDVAQPGRVMRTAEPGYAVTREPGYAVTRGA